MLSELIHLMTDPAHVAFEVVTEVVFILIGLLVGRLWLRHHDRVHHNDYQLRLQAHKDGVATGQSHHFSGQARDFAFPEPFDIGEREAFRYDRPAPRSVVGAADNPPRRPKAWPGESPAGEAQRKAFIGERERQQRLVNQWDPNGEAGL